MPFDPTAANDRDPAAPAQGAETSGVLTRPGWLRRAIAGAAYPATGAIFLLRRPRLWGFAVLVLILTLPPLVAGGALGAYAVPRIERLLLPGPGHLSVRLDFLVTLTLWSSALLSGMLAGVSLGLSLATPMSNALLRAVVTAGGLAQPPSPKAPGRAILHWLGVSTASLLALLPCVLLGVAPGIGPLLAAGWGGRVLGWRLVQPRLSQSGLGLREQFRWSQRWNAECFGLGVASALGLSLPIVQVVVAPALVVAGPLLALDLERAEPEATGREAPEGLASPPAAAEEDTRTP